MLDIGILLSLVLGTIRCMIPLLFGAVGEIITERAGIINIGIEGIMLLSAFNAAYGSWKTGNPYYGLLLGLVTGVILGLIYGYLSVKVRAIQVVLGLGLLTLAMGLTETLTIIVWKTFGYGRAVERLPALYTLATGERISYFLPVSLIMAVAAWFLLYKTKYGLRLRACGESAFAADAAGINVYRYRILATTLGAIYFALAGVYLSIDWNNIFIRMITGGRGWIALALVIFVRWNPLLAIAGSIFFGFFDEIQFWVSTSLQTGIPTQIPKMIPYIVTVIVIAIFGVKVRGPAEAGKPYIKE